MFYDVMSQLPFFAEINLYHEYIIKELMQENEIINSKRVLNQKK